jgi:phosphoglycerate dehydrogenase-like enzyme
MKIAFAGAFAVRLEERVRAHLTPAHDVVLADEPWPELAAKTLGILGHGRIGQCLARRATGAGATSLARRPFDELPDVLMTPHVSGWTEGMLEARAKLIAENVGRVARGEPPINPVA